MEDSSSPENLCCLCHTQGCPLSPGHVRPRRGLGALAPVSGGSCLLGPKLFLAHSQRVWQFIRLLLPSGTAPHRLAESQSQEGLWPREAVTLRHQASGAKLGRHCRSADSQPSTRLMTARSEAPLGFSEGAMLGPDKHVSETTW